MPSIGLTGTVGSGKSFALQILENLGAKTIQADRIGHELLKEPEVVERVVDLLGEGVLDEKGELDRKRIGEIVFHDPKIREEYDRVVHPVLLDRLKERLAKNGEDDGVTVVEAALIPEWGIEDWFDETWCVQCSDATALSRWRGDPERFWEIKRVQFDPEKKQTKARRVIENERSQEEFRSRIESEWRRFRGTGGR